MIISVSKFFCTTESTLSGGRTFIIGISESNIMCMKIFLAIAKMFSKGLILIYVMYKVLFPYTLTALCIINSIDLC